MKCCNASFTGGRSLLQGLVKLRLSQFKKGPPSTMTSPLFLGNLPSCPHAKQQLLALGIHLGLGKSLSDPLPTILADQ